MIIMVGSKVPVHTVLDQSVKSLHSDLQATGRERETEPGTTFET